MFRIKKKNPILKIIRGSLVQLPSPSNLRYFWNFGSLLGLSLSVQLVTGLFLAIRFSAETVVSFDAVTRLQQDVNRGWLLRIMHANGARIFFFFYIYM